MLSCYDFAVFIETTRIAEDISFFQMIGYEIEFFEREGISILTDGSVRILIKAGKKACSSLTLFLRNSPKFSSEIDQYDLRSNQMPPHLACLGASAYLIDPNGIHTYLFETPSFARSLSGHAPGRVCGTFSHLRLITNQIDATQEHYRKLGFRPNTHYQPQTSACVFLSTENLMLGVYSATPETEALVGQLAISYVDESIVSVIDRLSRRKVPTFSDPVSGSIDIRSPGGQVILLGNWSQYPSISRHF